MRVGTPGFVAARLTEAREARGLTQTALAELTGLKSQSISHYEQGRQSPSPEALALLCGRLDLPERFFLRAAPAGGPGAIFFRTVRPPSRTARLRAERRLGWLGEIAGWLDKYVELPAAHLPEIEIAPVEVAGREIEEAAESCRKFLVLGTAPVANSVALLENNGCIVTLHEEDAELEGAYSCWAGALPLVALEARDGHASRQNFDAAHELGHLVMHRRVTAAQAREQETHRAVEAQADRFARAFLLPAAAFGREVWAPTIDALLALKRDWHCPVGAMVRRCGEIGVFDADQVRRVFANMGRRGWRAHEPRDGRIPVERPKVLARGIRLLMESRVMDAHTMLAELALDAGDVEDLAGLPRNYFAERGRERQAEVRLREVEAG